jgi:signal transduction histidine kinase
VASTGRDALEDMRRLVGVLRGSETSPEQQRRAITLTELGTLIDGARNAGLDVELDNALPEQLPPAVELAVYRIAQEGLTNVLRHAGASAKVGLCLKHVDQRVTVSVTDDGGQTRYAPKQQGKGHGITGMRERVAVHGGTLSAGPVSPSGWTLTAEIPVLTAEIPA